MVKVKYYVISVAAEITGMHAQTLRTYDKLGLVIPERTSGGGRRYSEHDISRLQQIQQLSQEEGINLAGIKRIIELENKILKLEQQMEVLREAVQRSNSVGRELVLVPKTSEITIWRRQNIRTKRIP